MSSASQLALFPDLVDKKPVRNASASTFVDNMRLPVHRWYRFSAGFSASWAESLICDAANSGEVRVLDPFAGSGTTLLAAEDEGAESIGIEAHPFVFRIAQAKLNRLTDPDRYRQLARRIRHMADTQTPSTDHYPPLIHKCYQPESLERLDSLRRAVESIQDDSEEWRLGWLTLVSILRMTSYVNTAQWQYVLPNKTKKNVLDPFHAFDTQAEMFRHDMISARDRGGNSTARILHSDARTCEGVPDDFATLVVTSPPYPNNYDYADAARLEMSFLGEISGWGDLQNKVRSHLIRSCSQHVPQKSIDINSVLASDELEPIRSEITDVCEQLATIRLTKGGRKTYHNMVACYFYDLAQVWRSLRRVCDSPSRLCFVIGDSAPYGVYVSAVEWLGALADAAGFPQWTFEKTRDRNVKWKNRKHRVPLCEGRLWVDG